MLAAFLRAGNVSTWLDIGCGTCVVMESLLHSNITSSTSSSSALAPAIVPGPVFSPAMECVSEESMMLTTTDGGHSIHSSSSSSHGDTNDTTTAAAGSNTTTSSSSSSKGVSHNAPADLDMRVPTLRHITGLEYNIDPLKVAKKRLLVKIPRKEQMDSDLTSFSLWHGSILDEGVERDMQAQNEKETEKEAAHGDSLSTESTSNCLHLSSRIKSKFQAISCIEVIEHLPSEQDAAYALQKVLCDFQPEYALFSTPNYESNGSIRTAASIKPRKKTPTTDEAEPSVVGLLNKVDAFNEADTSETYREADHKFEFTRQQFRDWAYAGLKASNGQYEVQFTEVGSGLPGMGGSEKCTIQGQEGTLITGDGIHRGGLLFGRYTDEDGTLQRSRDRGCGGASQVAIFRRLKTNQGGGNVTGATDTVAPNGSMIESGSGSGSGDKPATLFWSWDKNASTDDDQGDSV